MATVPGLTALPALPHVAAPVTTLPAQQGQQAPAQQLSVADAEATFVAGVSQATGIDPRVVLAWVRLEGAYAKGGTGGYNFLNLRPYSSDVGVTKITSGNFDNFATVQDAITSTVARLRQPFASGILATAAKKPTPAQQIAAIAASGWDAGHYGGTGGPNLLSELASIFGSKAAGDTYESPANASAVAAEAGSGSAADWTSTDLTNVPGYKQVAQAVSTAKTLAEFLPKLLDPSTWRRFGLFVAGGLLLLAALFMFARAGGVDAIPVPV